MTWESISTFMQEPAGMVLMEIVCFLAGLLVLGIFFYRKKRGSTGSVTAGVSTSVSLLSYAWQQKSLLMLATTRAVLFLCILPFLGKDGYRLFTYASDSIGFKLLEIFVLLILIYIFFFISNIFELVATNYIFADLDHRPVTLKASLRRALSIKWMLCKFTFLDFLMSILARGGRNESSGGSRESKLSLIALFATIFASLVALSWRVATYFIMPVLLEEKASIIVAIKKSASTMKNSFGRVVGFHLGSTVLALILFFVAIAPLIIIFLIAWLCVTMKIVRLKYFMIPLLLGLIFAGICMVILNIIYTVMKWIFVCVAYNYTQDKNTGPFSSDFIRETIVTKQE